MGSGLSINNKKYKNSSSSTSKDILLKFKFLSLIGEGGLAIVKQAIYLPTNKVMAVKEIKFSNVRKHPKGFLLIESELSALKLAQSHPFIIQLNFAFYTKTTCYLVMNSLTGGDLRLYLSEGDIFNELIISYIIACIGSALYYLHKKNIIHRDVKPENIIFNRYGVPFLTDFGVAYVEYKERVPVCMESSGTLAYLAPEVLTPSHRHSYQADMWSLGIVAYELLFAIRPYILHCPKSFIYFVENYYHSLWDTLEENLLFDQTNDNALESKRTQITSSITGTHAIHPLSPDYKLYHELDWKSLPILGTIQFPDHLYQIDDINHLPEYLQTPIPLITPEEVNVSSSCINLISSLLDPRIPHRLGTNLQNYNIEWECHSWFIENKINFEAIFAGVDAFPPPFHPNIVKVMDATRSRFSHHNFSEMSSKNSSSSSDSVNNNNNNYNNGNNDDNNNSSIARSSNRLTEDEKIYLVGYNYINTEYMQQPPEPESSSWNFPFHWRKSDNPHTTTTITPNPVQNIIQSSNTNGGSNQRTRYMSEPQAPFEPNISV